MYSRYVPPSGPKASPRTANAPAPAAPVSAPPPDITIPPPVTAGAYGRYVPPPKWQPATTHVRFDDEPMEPPVKRAKVADSEDNAADSSEIVKEDTPDITERSEEKKKGKKPKKEKKEKSGKNEKKKKTKEPKEGGQEDGQEGDPEEARQEEAPVEDRTEDSPNVQDEQMDDDPAAVEKTTSPPPDAEQQGKKKKDKKRKERPAADDDDNTRKRHKSVFEKLEKAIKLVPESTPAPAGDEDVQMEDAAEPEEVHGLEPLPQPAPVVVGPFKPDYDTLPPWLSEPIRVSRDTAAPFTTFGLGPGLGISADEASKLAAKGYKEAFAVQTAVIPQLLPHHCRSMHSDILVSAATGSGKTLAYALPMIRDLSHGNPHAKTLRALVVLPTRELVRQAQHVLEECAGVFGSGGRRRRVQIGIAMGSQTVQKDQANLMEREEVYDPEGYQRRLKRVKASEWNARRDEDDNEDEAYESDDEEKKEIWRREDRLPTLPDHVVSYKSKVDVLVCTPGRLVELINLTPGFSLDHVRWLVVDEADKLLGQTFQQWLDVVIPRLQSNDRTFARDHCQSNLSGVRKVILSATMTRDLDLLSGLKLRRPKLVVLEGGEQQLAGAKVQHVLPEFLHESALKADAQLKPLFLLDLLQSPHILGTRHAAPAQDDDETSSSGSDSSDSDSSDVDPSSDSDSDTSSSSEAEERPARKASNAAKGSGSNTTTKTSDTNVLIFTKSNEAAIRLGRLLCLMAPGLASTIGTLTSTSAYGARKQTLRAFATGKLRVIVASDLIARGIDLPALDHVVNYDMPTSVASYVHRVGRTARAGRSGHAWTLFTDPEARWFWTAVAGADVRRSRKVERIRVTEEKEDAFETKKDKYEAALELLAKEAAEPRRRA